MDQIQTGSDRADLVCTQGLFAPVWDQSQTDPLLCVRDNWSCDWLSIENVIRFDRSVIACKIINKLSPENLWGKFQQRSSQCTYAKGIVKIYKFPGLLQNMRKRAINILL